MENSSKSPVVNITGLTKRYGDLLALDHLDLRIEEGEIFGLLGPNGSGKTTTISCLLSLLSYDKGSIELFGKPMTPVSYDIKKNIGIIMQDVAVYEELTVYENIDFFCGLYVTDKEKRKELVEEAIEFVGLTDFKKFHPKKLSGGLLRRLNIACGIAHKPKLIILDEPTVAVDPQSRNKILEGIEELNRNGATIIYTSHYMEEVEQLCSRIAIIDKGQKIAEGTKDELKGRIKNTETIHIEARSLEQKIIDEVKELPHAYDATYEDGFLTVLFSGGKHNMVRVLELMQKNNVHLGRITSELPTLNDVFLEITGKELRDKDED
ncbi:MAG: ABC transporter ATP-binding protein [Eubacterium sp.]|nr:ABC transporter ATP-binding protein [Eubacterium sp.]